MENKALLIVIALLVVGIVSIMLVSRDDEQGVIRPAMNATGPHIKTAKTRPVESIAVPAQAADTTTTEAMPETVIDAVGQ